MPQRYWWRHWEAIWASVAWGEARMAGQVASERAQV